MSPATMTAVQIEEAKSKMVSNNINVLLQTAVTTLKEMEIADIRLGKAKVCREGWKTEGYAVYAQVRGVVNGEVVLGIDPQIARQAVRRMLNKRLQISDFEIRLALQMLANDILISAMDLLAQVNIHVSLSSPQVFSRFEWTKTVMSKTPMIEVPLATDYGVCQLAFTLRAV